MSTLDHLYFRQGRLGASVRAARVVHIARGARISRVPRALRTRGAFTAVSHALVHRQRVLPLLSPLLAAGTTPPEGPELPLGLILSSCHGWLVLPIDELGPTRPRPLIGTEHGLFTSLKDSSVPELMVDALAIDLETALRPDDRSLSLAGWS